MVRKCGGTTAEVAAMDAATAGVRTRSRAAATASSSGGAAASADLAKRRRTEAAGDEESPLKLSSNNSTCTQLRNSSGGRNSASPPPVAVAVAVTENLRCPSTSSEDQASVSCCSSYGSSEVEKGKLIGFTDLEEECEADSSTSRFSRERREKTPSSEMGRGGGEDDSMDASVAKAAETNLPQRSEEEFQSSVDAKLGGLFVKIGKPEIKRPSDFEIEEFFAAAEATNLLELKHFKNKYNFDFVKDEPLKGRFEWHQVPPAEGKVSSK